MLLEPLLDSFVPAHVTREGRELLHNTTSLLGRGNLTSIFEGRISLLRRFLRLGIGKGHCAREGGDHRRRIAGHLAWLWHSEALWVDIYVLLPLTRHLHHLLRGLYALPDTAFAVVGDPRWGRQVWLLDTHCLLGSGLKIFLVAIFEWALLIETLHSFGLVHGLLGGRLPELPLACRISTIKRNISLGAALDRPTLLNSVEGAPFDLDLLSDHRRRRKLLALVRDLLLLLLATTTLTLLVILLWPTIFLFLLIRASFFIFVLFTFFSIPRGILFIPVETRIVLVTIEFAGAVVLENLPDVDLRSALEVHNAVVGLVMHIHEDVHVTEER